MPSWKRRPDGANWGDFGANDELGRLNLITSERRLAGLREAQEGLCFTLSLPLDFPGGDLQPPFRQPPRLSSTLSSHNLPVTDLFQIPDVPDTVNDDKVTLCTQYSTQWDSLCHIGCHFDADGDGVAESLYYNGFKAGLHVVSQDDSGNSRAHALGMEKMAMGGVQGRAVLVDLKRIYGEQKVSVGYDALMRALDAQAVDVRPGDFFCTYTGFGDLLLAMDKKPDAHRLHNSFADIDGKDERLLQWITDSGIVAICSDTMSIEAHPLQEGGCAAHRNFDTPLLSLHHHCIFKLGMYLGELWYFEELAAWLRSRNRSAFLLTAPPLRLPGAVGSPLTPVATV
jgi:kynurenine formamidase